MADGTEEGLEALASKITSRSWRLANLYKVRSEQGEILQFVPTATQQRLIDGLQPKNLDLKGRQMKVTTGYCTLWLDAALFNTDGLQIGIIAHTKGDASKIFKNKICMPYDNLPDEIKQAEGMEVVKRTESEIGFSNGANISVGVSFRSGNLQVLHVTEYGYICARQPLRAEEIRTGAFIAAQKGITVVESTAMGNFGDFAEMCAKGKKGGNASQWSYRFLPWFDEPGYTSDPNQVFQIYKDEQVYLKDLQHKIGRTLAMGQMIWWCQQRREYGDLVYQEFPSTDDEPFRVSTQGAYYGSEMLKLWLNKRITDVPVDRALLVDTWWDLGMNDEMFIWFVQRNGYEIRVVDCYHNSGEGLPHYVKVLDDWRIAHGVVFGRHIAPHDIRVRELNTGKSRLETAAGLGLRFDIAPSLPVVDGIDAVRAALPRCVFDEEKCQDGIYSLEHYRKAFNVQLGVYQNQPLKDKSAHGADAFRMGIVSESVMPSVGNSSPSRIAARPIQQQRWR